MKDQNLPELMALEEAMMHQLNAQILDCQAKTTAECPELSPFFEESTPIAWVENTGPIESHNLAAFLAQLEAMVDGYACSLPGPMHA